VEESIQAVEPDVVGVVFPAAGETGGDSEGKEGHAQTGNPDGGFIMHLAQAGLGLRCHSGFCLSGAPNRAGVVRLAG